MQQPLRYSEMSQSFIQEGIGLIQPPRAVHTVVSARSSMTCFNEKKHAVEASPKDLAPSESPEQDPSPSSDEKVISWEDFYNDDYPNKKQSRLTRNLRFQIFNVYRRLFCAVFIANMAIFVAFCVRGASVPKLGEVAIANLFVATLCCQEYVINAIFFVLCSAPKS
ncbi:hypothetical protein FB446DRAFT_788016 [Lentinula raphanica]|nr:hypothetical protein FB446DRAFT_788016 [Lentinula raphanica]